jgi:hypothetical protein
LTNLEVSPEAAGSTVEPTLEPILPGAFIAMQMDNRKYHDIGMIDAVKDAVRKPPW